MHTVKVSSLLENLSLLNFLQRAKAYNAKNWSRDARWPHHWFMLCIFGLYIVSVYLRKNADRFLLTFLAEHLGNVLAFYDN